MTIEIEWEDVELILRKKGLENLNQELKSCHCPACKRLGNATLAIKKIWLNHIGDLIFDGWCKDCAFKLSLYHEANQDEINFEQAMIIREIKIDLLKNYNIKP